MILRGKSWGSAKGCDLMMNYRKKTLAGIAALAMLFTTAFGCSEYKESSEKAETTSQSEEAASETETTSSAGNEKKNSGAEASNVSYSPKDGGVIDTTDLFSKRDLEQEADLSEASLLQAADGKTIDITEAGVYIISGSAKNCTIRVEAAKEDKVQLVLDGVSITNDDFPAIYVVSADKCFITTAEDSENSLTVSGEFRADGDTNTDAVIFSKDDIVLNGLGTLKITSDQGNGISGKDDIKITGGTYEINTLKDAVEANESIAVCGGKFTVSTDKDGFHSENDEDDTVGWIYISDGDFTIDSGSDGIQGTTYVQIDGGTFDITSAEGIEATYVQINDGTISIDASDDGINATNKSSFCDIVVEFNGGYTTIVMGPGDTDGVDANGSVYVNGGTIDITAQMSSFDYDREAQFNGGKIIVNGEEVSEIPQSMMGGGHGGMGGFGGGMGGRQGGFGNFDGSEMPEDFGDFEGMTPPESFGDFEGMTPPEGFENMTPPEGFENMTPPEDFGRKRSETDTESGATQKKGSRQSGSSNNTEKATAESTGNDIII